MKKILSLILAVVMVALLVPASVITAEDVAVKAGNKFNIKETDGVFEVEQDGTWGVYVLGESTNWEVTMTMHSEVVNAEYGLQICGKDNDGDGVLVCEGGYTDSFLQVFNTTQNEVQLIGCNGTWGNVGGYQWGDQTRFTGVEWGNDVTWTVKLNGNQLSYWVDGQQCGDTIVLDESVMYGNVVTLLMKHTNTSISNVTFVDHNAVVEPVDPVDPVDPNAAIFKVVSKTVKCTDREVTLEVMLENNPGMNVLMFTPKADNSGFTYESSKITKGDIFDSLTKGPNPTFSYEEEDGDTTATGLICTITFAIDESVEPGTYRIDLTYVELINNDVEDVPYTIEAGYITIAHGDGNEVVDAKYLKSEATCSQKAVYYKSCECGAQLEDTFEYGELLAHTFVENATEDYLNTPATCNKAATYFESCSVCGAKGEKTFENGVPTGDHNYANLKHDANKHWYECGCGAKSDEADHVYDNACDTDCNVCGETRTTEHTWAENAADEYLKTAASCSTKAVYYKSCSVCGAKSEDVFEYGDPTGNHNYTDEWKHDENKHWHECGCGAKSDEADHDFGEGVVTTEPTTDAEGVKTFTCVCGATKTESIDKLPAEAPKTGTTTALAVAVALLTASTGAAVVITRRKRSI